jgi:hypothetical protein
MEDEPLPRLGNAPAAIRASGGPERRVSNETREVR